MRTDGKLVIRISAGVALAAVLAIVVAVFAGASQAGAKTHANTSVSGSVNFWGIWSAAEQTAFQKVIAGFNRKYPNVKVHYTSKGNNMPTELATAIAGGNPPDIADVAQPGLVKQLVQQHHLKPITYAKKIISQNFAPAWVKLGVVNKKLYALLYKASNKSTLWYNVHSFKQAGVKAPKTWSQLLKDAKTIKASGTPPYSLCGSSGWTLTDLFENIYLRTFGPAKYNKLSAHKLKWTDPSVTKALTEMKQIIGNSANLYGGRNGALQTGYPQCVDFVYSTPPKAAMVIEADFVANEILQATNAKPKKDFNVTPFPAITKGKDASAIETSGDEIITFRNTPAIQAFVKYLATPKAAEIWAKLGGFGTGNLHVPASVYPDAITRATEAPLTKAKAAVFDMSDEQPAAFGSTTGQGEWGLFQKFLQNPSKIKSIQKQLEAAAKAAYKK
ncbi:MAG TPA: extracellular solute-binding protein [Gaiellaceae bacterium]|nr:extracellular solute-binding protein [Gaiellaceae bacterium]